jgi:hypothetical protein
LIAKVKEKTMANKNFWLGILVMVLVFGMTVAGCKEFHPGYCKITNGTAFDITLVVFETNGGSVVKSDPVGILSGKTKEYEFDEFHGKVTATVSVNSENVEIVYRYVSAIGGEDGWSGTTLLLNGTTKETLKFDSN